MRNPSWADELLIWQHPVLDGEITHTIQEMTHHNRPLSSFISHVIDVRRPGESVV